MSEPDPLTVDLAYYSHLKTFTRWIGKPKLLKPISAYFDDPALYTRSYCASEDKSWRAMGVDVFTVIRDVEAYDVHAAACLWLMLAFGLRFKESLMLRPHRDVLTAQQAGDPANGPARYLDTHRGTKGGRDRLLPIDSPQREAAVAQACSVAIDADDSVSDPRRTLAQAERRLRYVMERHGITRAGLKVVPHGLRHQDPADAYRAMTDQPPPVAGGGAVDPALDAHARQAIAEHLGHGRPAIANAYLGRPHPGTKASSPAAHPNPDTRNSEPQGDE
jgi:integrase